MRIIVTGATGYVGRALVPHLSRLGYTGVAVGRKTAFALPQGWSYAERDQILTRGEAGDWLVHLEVKQHVLAPTEKDLREFEEVNVLGTIQWLEWCSRFDVRKFLYFSSIKAVNPEFETAPADESATGPGDTPYGKSKWAAEEAVRKWAGRDSKQRGVIVRPAVIYGPRNKANVSAMVKAIDKQRFFLPDGGKNIKSLVSIGNVVAAVAHFLGKSSEACETYNLVDSRSYTVREFSSLIAGALGKNYTPASIPAALLVLPAFFGDIAARIGLGFPLTSSRLKALTEQTWFTGAKLERSGFHPPESTELAVSMLIEWYRSSSQNPGNKPPEAT